MDGARRVDLTRRLAEVREGTLRLLAPLSDEDYVALHAPVAGPVAWDVPHIASFEELWLVKRIGPEAVKWAAATEGLDPMYDAGLHPKPERAALPLPGRAAAIREMERVRAASLGVLAEVDLADGSALVRDGFVHEMVLQHEAQHQETVLITLSLVPRGRYVPARREAKPRPAARPSGMVEVPAGPFEMGTDRRPGTYDNEWPRHLVDLPAFWIARAPVTNGEYLRFVDDGGYEREELWSEDGWLMRALKGWERPLHWERAADGRVFRREFDRLDPLPFDEPVSCVSFYEAEAYARWAGMRLPTEAEWEKAATWDPATGAKRAFPWGDAPWTPERANLGQRLFGPAPVGAYPGGASAVGCHQMLGDVWEWTATEFAAYPGFEAFPYREYSEAFLGRGYFVLRGGSWATRPEVARGTFRNWHQQDHQQEFAGFRLASSAPPEAAP